MQETRSDQARLTPGSAGRKGKEREGDAGRGREGDTETRGKSERETRGKIDVALHLACNVVFFSRPLATLTQDAKIAKKGHDS